MEHYVGLDVSLKLTEIGIIDRTGNRAQRLPSAKREQSH
jgi:hypothetical protein